MSTPIESWTLDGIKNPLALQSLLLDEFEQSSGGRYTIADGNNVVAFLMTAFSSLTSGIVRKLDDSVLPAIYPSRAVSISDMYKHLSDYEYLGLFASPASSKVILIVDKGYLMRHAVPVYSEDGTTEIYRKVVIPKSSKFRMGSRTFGLYYPIVIKVSNNTGMFTVEYDTTENNPLHVLNENVLDHKFFRNDGTVLAYITIPVYQFDTTVVEEPLVAGTGFKKSISFTDQFYAVKCFADVRKVVVDADGNEADEWVNQELSLSLSGRSYDSATPTVVFDVDPDSKTLNLSIPYVYFTNNQIRGRLKVELYTTAGYLNYNIPTNTEELVGLDFFSVALESSVARYAEPFRTIPSLAAVPATMVVRGGTNGMSYNEIRRRILTNSFVDKTLQTPSDVDAYFANMGYITSLYQDGITDRIFISHSVLRDENNEIVGAASVDTLVDRNMFDKSNTRTIVKVDEDVYTILPSTRYRFDKDAGICVPLTDAELETLDGLDNASKVVEFNDNTYTLCPFHVQCNVSDKYPSTCTFDLNDCGIEAREFLYSRNNDTSSGTSNKQLSLTVASLIPTTNTAGYTTSHSSRVTDTYQLVLQMTRSGMDNVAADRFGAYVGLKTVTGSYVWTFVHTPTISGNNLYFQLGINVTAAFTLVDGQYAVKVQAPFSNVGANVLLTCEAKIICCSMDYDIARTKGRSITEDGSTNIAGIIVSGSIPPTGLDGFIAFTEHRLTLRFGKQVNELDHRIALSYSENAYETFNTTELTVLNNPKYKTDEMGVPVIKDSKLEVEYPKGTILSVTEDLPAGEMVYAHTLLASNRTGCGYWLETDDPDKDDARIYGSETILDGTKILLNGKIIPRFKISNTKKIAGVASDVVGYYELADARSHVGGISKLDDVWFKIDKVDDAVTVHEVKTYEALEFIYNNCTTVLDGANINNIQGVHTGSFVLIKNDATPMTEEEETRVTNTINFVTLTTGLTTKRTRLYQRLGTSWKCILICNELKELTDYFGEYDGRIVHGYVYAIKKEGETSYSYVSFLNTNEDGSVNISPLSLTAMTYKVTDDTVVDPSKTYFTKNADSYIPLSGMTEFKEGLTYYEEDVEIPVDQWANKVNKWPWDAKQWNSIESSDITYADGSGTSVTEAFLMCSTDTYFDIRFDSGRMYKYVNHLSTHPRLDDNGKPRLDPNGAREVKFMINMLHLDAKLAVPTLSGSKVYPDNLVEVMRTHFNNLGSIKNRLYTNTRLYFEPIKSLGYGKFYTDGESIKTLPLDVTMKFRLHVSNDVAEDEDLMNAMRTSIIALIDDHMAGGSTNMTTLAQAIRESNSDSVKYVDVLGIDGDPSLQTMRAVDNSIKPHLKHVLVLMDDKETIDVDRGLELEFVVADS